MQHFEWKHEADVRVPITHEVTQYETHDPYSHGYGYEAHSEDHPTVHHPIRHEETLTREVTEVPQLAVAHRLHPTEHRVYDHESPHDFYGHVEQAYVPAYHNEHATGAYHPYTHEYLHNTVSEHHEPLVTHHETAVVAHHITDAFAVPAAHAIDAQTAQHDAAEHHDQLALTHHEIVAAPVVHHEEIVHKVVSHPVTTHHAENLHQSSHDEIIGTHHKAQTAYHAKGTALPNVHHESLHIAASHH